MVKKPKFWSWNQSSEQKIAKAIDYTLDSMHGFKMIIPFFKQVVDRGTKANTAQ